MTAPLMHRVAAPAVVPPPRQRIESIDVVRGVIMILMALDHTRDYFGATSISPTDLARTTGALFFTRWITHICAPVFFLLTGTGVCLALARRTPRQMAWLLLTRGLWLIVLELTVVRCLGYQFNFDYRLTLLVVLWALGWAMIALSPLVFLPPAAVAAIGAAVIGTHNLFDGVRVASTSPWAPLWTILHRQAVVVASPQHTVFVAYPLIPWVGVTAVGFGLGHLYRSRARIDRRRVLWWSGAVLTAAFLVLRWSNAYGDPVGWSVQRSAEMTVLSFINTTKYPPSLLFLLMTLGPALLLLSIVDGRTPRVLRPARVYGSVPLFYFVLHLFVIHLGAVIVCLIRYGDAHWMFESPTLAQYPISQPPGWGFALPIVYLAWLTVVVVLYPACRWYASVKRRRTDWWLSYL